MGSASSPSLPVDAQRSAGAPAPASARVGGPLALAEWILKSPARVEALVRDPSAALELIPRLLAVALFSFTLYGAAMAVLLEMGRVVLPLLPPARIADGSALFLVLAYDLGLVAACGVCLPSFYFYGLLAGIRPSMAQVAVHAIQGLAVTGIVLLGILPIYVAFALGLVVFEAAQDSMELAFYAGLCLPFLAGLWGLRALHRSFVGLTWSLPERCRTSRYCFLRRLIAAWGVCYTAVTPVMIFTLWRWFTGFKVF
jgi:hypothetical protein